MVEPLSNRSQLISPSIQTLAILSGLLHWLSRSGLKKGTFWDIFRLWEPHLGMLVEWLMVSEGSRFPSSSPPLLCLNLLFWQPCWDPLENLSPDAQDSHIQNYSSFSFGIAWLHWQIGWYIGWYSWGAALLHQFHWGLPVLPLKIQPLLPLLDLQLSLHQFQHFLLWWIKPWRCNCPSAS